MGKAANEAWSIVPSPNIGIDDNHLFSVAAVSRIDVWAVGSYGVDPYSGIINPLTMHWNGTQWLPVSAPAGTNSELTELLGVTAVSGDDAWAVGYYIASNGVEQTYTLRWRNSQWNYVLSPNQGTGSNRLTSVAFVSSNEVWAVGSYNTGTTTRTLIMKWNGTAWSIIPSPSPARPNSIADYLTGVAAATSGDVKAVGYYFDGSQYRTLILHWDPATSTWTAPATPNVGSGANYLKSIAIIGTGFNNAYAVGYYFDISGKQRTLILRYTGSPWSLDTSPNYGTNDNQLNGVAAIASGNIWAVGNFVKPPMSTLTEHRTATAWSIVGSPNQTGNDNYLQAIAVVPGTSSCAGGDIWSVGYYSDLNNGSVARTLTLRYTITASCAPPP